MAVDLEMSIVVGTRNRPEAWKRFLQSVRDTMTVPYEVLVGDASDDPRYVEEEEHVRVLVERPRLGYCRGFNRCFWHSKSEYVAFFNDDAVLLSGWDRAALDFMRANPCVAVGAVYFKDSCGHNNSPNHTLQSAFGLTVANFGVVKRTLGCDLGWFDERFTMYGREYNLMEAPPDQQLFKSLWDGKGPELREKHARYAHLDVTRSIK